MVIAGRVERRPELSRGRDRRPVLTLVVNGGGHYWPIRWRVSLRGRLAIAALRIRRNDDVAVGGWPNHGVFRATTVARIGRWRCRLSHSASTTR
jgi:hypothetical protein